MVRFHWPESDEDAFGLGRVYKRSSFALGYDGRVCGLKGAGEGVR